MATIQAQLPLEIPLNFKVLTCNEFNKLPAFFQDSPPTCGICFEEFVKNSDPDKEMPLAYHDCEVSEKSQRFITVKPIHSHHLTCFVNWLTNKHTCPQCNGKVDANKFITDIANQFLPLQRALDSDEGEWVEEEEMDQVPVASSALRASIQAVVLTSSEQYARAITDVKKVVKEVFYFISQFTLIILASLAASCVIGPFALIVTALMTKSLAVELRQKHYS